MKRPLALLFVPLVLSLSACAVVGVKVDAQSSASVRRDALQVVRQNRQSPAAVALAGAQEKKLSEPARAVALLKAAEMSAAGRPGTPDHAVNVAATRGLLSLMAGRDFAPLPLGNGKMLGVSSDSRTTTDPRAATSVFPADNVRITKLRVRTEQDGAGLACVAHFAAKSPALAGQAGVPPRAGLCEPVTALVRADGRNP
ncbi:MAG: hypothetical protein ACKOD5_02775, partial [Chthoniobacterales bacterium]